MKIAKNKKAQIGSTLVWVVATFIILFIMIIYLFGVGLLTAKSALVNTVKKITGFFSKDQISVIDQGTIQSFFAFMNTKVNYNDKEIKVKELLIISASNYNSIKDSKGNGLIDKYGIKTLDEPSDTLKNKMLLQDFNENDWKKYVDYENDDQNKMSPILVKELTSYCGEFYFSIPQGIVTNSGLKIRSTIGDVFSNSWPRSDEFIPTISYPIIIGNSNYEIKFRMLKTC